MKPIVRCVTAVDSYEFLFYSSGNGIRRTINSVISVFAREILRIIQDYYLNVTTEDGNDGTMFPETIPSTNPACIMTDRSLGSEVQVIRQSEGWSHSTREGMPMDILHG